MSVSKNLERREKSNNKIKEMGILCLESLPILDENMELNLKSLDDICKRAISSLLSIQIACDINAGNDYEESNKILSNLLKEYKVEDCLNPTEKKLFNGEYTQQDTIDVTWTYESYWSLVWALGLIEDISLPNEICDCEKAIKLVSEARSFDEFKAKCKLRDVEEILDMLDLHYRYHWACEKSINPNTPIGELNPEVVVERRRGLEWLFSEEEDWFEISLDT